MVVKVEHPNKSKEKMMQKMESSEIDTVITEMTERVPKVISSFLEEEKRKALRLFHSGDLTNEQKRRLMVHIGALTGIGRDVYLKEETLDLLFDLTSLS